MSEVIQLEGLSAAAIGLAGTLFSRVPRNGEAGVTVGTPSRITAQACFALDELEAAGVVVREPFGEAGLKFRPLVDCGPAEDWVGEHLDDPALHLSFVTDPHPEDAILFDGDLRLPLASPATHMPLLGAAIAARFERDATAEILQRAHEIILLGDDLLSRWGVPEAYREHPYFAARAGLGEEVKTLPSHAELVLKAWRDAA